MFLRWLLDLLTLCFSLSRACTHPHAAASLSLTDPTWRYAGPPALSAAAACVNSSADCMSLVCGAGTAAAPVSALKISLIDTAREARMQLGRDWPYADAPPGRGQVRAPSPHPSHMLLVIFGDYFCMLTRAYSS